MPHGAINCNVGSSHMTATTTPPRPPQILLDRFRTTLAPPPFLTSTGGSGYAGMAREAAPEAQASKHRHHEQKSPCSVPSLERVGSGTSSYPRALGITSFWQPARQPLWRGECPHGWWRGNARSVVTVHVHAGAAAISRRGESDKPPGGWDMA